MKPSLSTAFRLTRTTLNTLSPLARAAVTSQEEQNMFRTAFDQVIRSTNTVDGPSANDESAIIFDATFHSIEKVSKKNANGISTIPYDKLMFKGKTTPISSNSSLQRHKSTKMALENTINTLQSGQMSDFEISEFMWTTLQSFDSKINQINKKTKFGESLIEQIKIKSNESPLSPPINEYTVPVLVAESIRILTNTYKSPDTALSIFHLAKKQSLKSFIYVCTTPVYNQVIESHWESYKSISSILELVNEMKVNGIKPNTDTYYALKKISEDAHTMLLDEDQDDISFTFNYERGPERWTQMWNKADEDDLHSVDQYMRDVLTLVTRRA